MSAAFAGANSDTEGPGDMVRVAVAEEANAPGGAGINEPTTPIAAATIASLVLIIVIALR
jgi:hypothetical protein